MMVGLRVHRIECDELWAYVGHQRNPQKGARAWRTKILTYRTGKRTATMTGDFIQDLRERVIGACSTGHPEL